MISIKASRKAFSFPMISESSLNALFSLKVAERNSSRFLRLSPQRMLWTFASKSFQYDSILTLEISSESLSAIARFNVAMENSLLFIHVSIFFLFAAFSAEPILCSAFLNKIALIVFQLLNSFEEMLESSS